MEYTGSLILFFTVLICFIASFDKRLGFNRHFGAFIKAAILVAIPFSCVFTYYSIDKYYKYYKWDSLSAFNNILVFVSVIVLSLVALLNTIKCIHRLRLLQRF